MANYERNFTDKDARITLVDGDKVLTEEKVVIIFKDHFEKIVETLKLHRLIFSDLSDDPALNAIENFYHLASVLKIKEARDSSDCLSFNPLNANPTKWSKTLKQFGNLLTNCLSVFDQFVKLALEGLN